MRCNRTLGRLLDDPDLFLRIPFHQQRTDKQVPLAVALCIPNLTGALRALMLDDFSNLVFEDGLNDFPPVFFAFCQRFGEMKSLFGGDVSW